MLRDEKITISISYRNKGHYVKLGYNPIISKDLEILTEHLTTHSKTLVVAICPICGAEKTISYGKYMENKKRLGYYGCKKCSRQKAAITSMEKYGVDNYSKTDEWKERVAETNIKKFGYKTNLLNPEHIQLRSDIMIEKYGTDKFYELKNNEGRKRFVFNEEIYDLINDNVVLSEDLYDYSLVNKDYHTYNVYCRTMTKNNGKLLFENWDGTDYYTKEDISNNFELDFNDPSYPTIDHKISVYYGYNNKIDPDIIASIDNLCVTKRGINSAKCTMCEDEFMNLLKI